MKQAAKQILACSFLLLIFCLLLRLAAPKTFTAYIPVDSASREPGMQEDDLQVEIEHPEILRQEDMEVLDGYLKVSYRPEHAGETMVDILGKDGQRYAGHYIHVDPFMNVFDLTNRNFSGDSILLAGITLFWFLVTLIMIWHYFRSSGSAFYSYSTIYYAGFSLFTAANCILMLRVTIAHLRDPMRYSMMEGYSTINSSSIEFMVLTMPIVLLFAGSMAVSNIALLRHERPRIQNFLGILISLFLILGEAAGWLFFTKDFSGSELMYQVHNTNGNVYATIFVYFECLLAGSVICGIKAARHQPSYDKDFIIILGCWFRKDGTLPPLLRGRVEHAITFWQKQKQATGKEAFFVPSGGQGPDETMPEAEAMRRYLLERQIPGHLILAEDQSRNTFQNMAFSKKLIEMQLPEDTSHPYDSPGHPSEAVNAGCGKCRIIFSTTNYHVFRSGIWASNAGLDAEGIGSKTKWWFWPNAFIRECIGLMQLRWKTELLLLVSLIAFFGLLSWILI